MERVSTKYIEDRLKEYKENESTIETTLARIEVYKNAINDAGDWTAFTHLFTGSQTEIGIPRGTGGRPSSSIELEIENDEENEEEVTETLKEWIREDQSRIYPLQIEKEQIDGALSALTRQQRYIIQCKYFDVMRWNDVEINFNNTFNLNNSKYLTYEALKKRNKVSLNKLLRILKPYYSKFDIKIT